MAGPGSDQEYDFTFQYQGGLGENAVKYISELNDGHINVTRGVKCPWFEKKDDPSQFPHTKAVNWRKSDPILNNILHAIGNSKLVRLNRIPQSEGIKCEMLVKCEYLNPGGSVKDRIGIRLLEDAEYQGLIKKGSTIIEPTSGNTGIGLALAAAVKGYRLIVVMSEKMSQEKVAVLKALGAEVVRVPITEGTATENGLFAVSYRLKNSIPNSIILDQYTNPGNPLAHYDTTAEEILHDCQGKLDMLVIAAGTGGTISGIGKKMKELSPQTVIVGLDPYGSVMAHPSTLNKSDVTFYEVEGIGYDFMPSVLDYHVVDKWIKTRDMEAFAMARRLIREEGMLVGGSSGTALAGAIEAAKDLKEGQRCVVILPDSIRNYLSKFVSDNWMEMKRYKSVENVHNFWWWDHPVSKLHIKPIITVTSNETYKVAIDKMKNAGVEHIPVVDEKGVLIGMSSLEIILTKLSLVELKDGDPVMKALTNIYPKIYMTDCLGLVSRILEVQPCALIVEEQNGILRPSGMVKKIDLLEFTTNNVAK